MIGVRGWDGEPPREHEPLNLEEYPEVKAYLESHTLNWQDAHILGLHYTNKGICPGNFVGMVWVGEGSNRTVLRVHSKFPQMDYIKMFAECCAHPDIGSRMDGCFKCWPDEDYIDTNDSPDFLPTVPVSFLRALNQLCVRHLRKNFERQRKNFIGKVKGKILVSENLRQNIVRGRLDRVFCEYQSFSDDILENRILRAALERAARYVASSNILKENIELQRQIHTCRSCLQGVSVMPISRSQFASARNRGVFAFYRDSLHLAKMVLQRFGFNPHEEIISSSKTPPFAINSAELFERYAQLKLLTEFPKLLAPVNNIPGYDDFDVQVRPDFYVPKDDALPEGESWVIDAKYKEFYDTPKREDTYQVVAYSRHRRLRQTMGCGENDNVHVSLAYPFFGDKTSPFINHKTNAFLSNFSIYEIPCPIKESD